MGRNRPNRMFDYNVDIRSKKAKQLRKFFQKDKEYRIHRLEEDVSYRIMLWLKYFRYDYETFEQLVKTILDGYLTNVIPNKQIFYQNVEKILLEKHKIKIISKDPLILESKVPFKDLEERY